MAISSALKKTTLLLLITTLTISLGTSLTWENPAENGEEFDASITLNVSDFSNNGDIVFEYKSEEDESFTSINTVSPGSEDNYSTQDFSAGDTGPYGNYEFRANDTNGEEITRQEIMLDGNAPEVTFSDNLNYVRGDPTITVDVEDVDTGINSVDASIGSGDAIIDNVDDDDCDGSESCEVEIDVDTSDMADGDSFDLDVTPEDLVGNTDTQNKDDITLDDSWDGDSSADVEWDESGSNVLTGFAGEDQDVLISFQPDSVSDTTLTCSANGEEMTDTVSASDEEETAECRFDHEDYASSSFDLTVEVEDEAGNSETIVDEKEMVWDTQKPSISELTQPDGVSTFNSGFDLSLTATDDASGIQMVEYYFDASTGVGDGNQISLDNSGGTAVESDFTVEPDLGQGEHTVYVRVEDGTGQTDVQSFDFEYFPDREPSVNLNAPESVEVTSGETESFTLTIENGAPFFINGVEIQSDSAVWNGTVTATSLEEGDSVEKTVTVDASNVDVGTYDLKLETVDLSNSMTVEVIVRATEDQKSSIDSELQEWQDLSSELEENVSSIGTIDESDENVSRFLSRVNSVQSAVDEGRYYEAKSHLESIDSEYESAQATYSEAKDEHETKMRNRIFMLAIFGVLIIGGGGTGLLLYSRNSEELPDFVPEDIDVEIPEEVPQLGVVDKVKELIQDAEEEVEDETGYSFDGFD